MVLKPGGKDLGSCWGELEAGEGNFGRQRWKEAVEDYPTTPVQPSITMAGKAVRSCFVRAPG